MEHARRRPRCSNIMAVGKLSLYQAKRDFTKTAEPSGKAHVQAGGIPPLCHPEARRHPAALRSSPRAGRGLQVLGGHQGPSLDPRDKRLAVEVEDHPLDYGDFEGTIPQGEYGGGTVMLWDRGFWAPEDGAIRTALRKGDLKFTLAGEKLQGSWVLVRMRHDRERGSNRNNWLLIKHRDGYEREGGEPVTDQDRSVASGRTMEEIAAGKGRRPKPFMLGRQGRCIAMRSGIRTGMASRTRHPS